MLINKVIFISIMILKFIKLGTQQPLRYKFASAAASAVDYYSLLGV